MEQQLGTRGQRSHGDEGAAVVEMALVGVLLVLLLMGIIAFGYLMAFRQNLVQAATEGARAGATAVQGSAEVDATQAAEQAVIGFDKRCSDIGMTCAVSVAQCPNAVTRQCVTVEMTYDYKNHPILPDIPLLSTAMPEDIHAIAIAEVNQ